MSLSSTVERAVWCRACFTVGLWPTAGA
eukprot:IDg8919t1